MKALRSRYLRNHPDEPNVRGARHAIAAQPLFSSRAPSLAGTSLSRCVLVRLLLRRFVGGVRGAFLASSAASSAARSAVRVAAAAAFLLAAATAAFGARAAGGVCGFEPAVLALVALLAAVEALAVELLLLCVR